MSLPPNRIFYDSPYSHGSSSIAHVGYETYQKNGWGDKTPAEFEVEWWLPTQHHLDVLREVRITCKYNTCNTHSVIRTCKITPNYITIHSKLEIM